MLCILALLNNNVTGHWQYLELLGATERCFHLNNMNILLGIGLCNLCSTDLVLLDLWHKALMIVWIEFFVMISLYSLFWCGQGCSALFAGCFGNSWYMDRARCLRARNINFFIKHPQKHRHNWKFGCTGVIHCTTGNVCNCWQHMHPWAGIVLWLSLTSDKVCWRLSHWHLY